MSSYDWREVKSSIDTLSKSAPIPTDEEMRQIQEFLDVGEYDLALDNISHFYLEAGTAVPLAAFDTIERLAAALDTVSDPEYSAVAQLLAAGRPRP